RRVRAKVLELLHDPESAGRRLDSPGRLVSRLLVVPPRPRLAPDRQRHDALDDRVVGVDVAVEATDFTVGDDIEPRALHVPDRGVRGVVEHLLEVGGPVVARFVGLDGREPPAGLAMRADDGGWNQRQISHRQFSYALPAMIRITPRSARTSPGRPAKMISPRSIT